MIPRSRGTGATVLLGSLGVAFSLLASSCAPAAAPAPAPAAPPAASAPAPAAAPPRPAAPAQPSAPSAAPAATPTRAAGAAATPSPASRPASPAAATPKKGGILTITVYSDPPHYDTTVGSFSIVATAGMMHAGLLRYDMQDNGKMVPDLAASWDVAGDDKQYTFRLQKNAKWHDGKPVTADDVKYTMEKRIKPDPGGLQDTSDFDAVKSIEVVDANTVKVSLSQPSYSFLPALAGAQRNPILPKHLLEKSKNYRKETVGAGAFKFKQHAPGVVFEVERFKDYFLPGLPYLDGIRGALIEDAGTRLAALRTHRVQLTTLGVGGIQPTDMPIIQQVKGITVVPYATGSFFHVMPNPNVKPWNDIRVRRAAHLAIDRTDVNKLVKQGTGFVGGFLLRPNEFARPIEYYEKLPGYRLPKDQDIAEAKRLMAEAGYPNGFKTNVLVRRSGFGPALSEVLRQQWLKIGIDATLDIQPQAIEADRRYAEQWDVIAYGAGAGIMDPDASLGRGVLNPLFTFGKTDKKAQELFTRQGMTLDPAKRKIILQELEDYMFEQLPAFPFFYDSGPQAVWNEVKGYGVPDGIYSIHNYVTVWLDQ
ncbi:MAG: ABC transporter substrate-binding protein [Dehalococcoidia bacterium]|nr:ABC transporter substrate-binding protein [Dehalococcoidia bacterium]